MRKKYEYLHLLAFSQFDHKINQVTFTPDLSSYGREGWEMTRLLSTKQDGVYDIFFKRKAGYKLSWSLPKGLRSFFRG